MWKTLGKLLLGLCLASVATGVIGTVVQAYLNLTALQAANPNAIGGPYTLDHWLTVIRHDLVNFAPLLALLSVASFVPAFTLAGIMARLLKGRAIWFLLAGLAGLATTLITVNTASTMPHLLVATHTWPGLLALSASGLVGGWLFALCTRPNHRQGALDHVVLR
ncbi:MAG: hypothetical protein WED11_07545 [Natronospirillum sp.]